jgi:AcrR family transcriptional regulator
MSDERAPEQVVSARRRGRPRGRSNARERILQAAAAEFGESGYDGATIRGVASRAGVDAALVHHYFGAKADLFAATVDVPVRPDLAVPQILAGDRDGWGEAVVRYVLEQFEKPDVRARGVVLLRTAIGNKVATPLMVGFLTRELLSRIVAVLRVDDAELRASLAASQIVGMLVARHVVRLPGIATASVDELVARVGPTVQRYLTA